MLSIPATVIHLGRSGGSRLVCICSKIETITDDSGSTPFGQRTRAAAAGRDELHFVLSVEIACHEDFGGRGDGVAVGDCGEDHNFLVDEGTGQAVRLLEALFSDSGIGVAIGGGEVDQVRDSFW